MGSACSKDSAGIDHPNKKDDEVRLARSTTMIKGGKPKNGDGLKVNRATPFFKFKQDFAKPIADTGLHIEEEMLKLKSKMKELVDKLFDDPEFHKKNTSISDDIAKFKTYFEVDKDPEWMRAKDLFGDGMCVFNDISPCDIIQGNLCDCYFLSSLSVLAERPHFIYQLFETKEVNPNGLYSVWLCMDGEWKSILLDDYLPLEVDSKGNKKPLFAKTKSKELWVLLLEKAYAKYYKNYHKISLGYGYYALRDLTGAPTYSLTRKKYTDDELWEEMKGNNDYGYVMVCSSNSARELESREKNGIISSHEYGILDLREVQSKGKPEKLILLRNPWGSDEWVGAWSDSSDLWTEELRTQLHAVKKEDGLFWMPFKDFLDNYSCISVCCICEGYSYQSLKVDPNKDHKQTNHYAFKIKVNKKGYYYFSVNQQDERHRPDLDYPYGFVTVILSKDEPSPSAINWFGHRDRNTCVESELEPGNYTLYVNIDWLDFTPIPFVISSYQPAQVELSEVIYDDNDFFKHVRKALMSPAINGPTLKELQNNENSHKSEVGEVGGLYFINLHNPSADKPLIDTLQFEVYENAKYKGTWENEKEKKIKINIPPGGYIQLVFFRDEKKKPINVTYKSISAAPAA